MENNSISIGCQNASTNAKSETHTTPSFVANTQGSKVLSVIEREMKSCDDFCLSVAFITMGGITPLLGTLKELEEKNVHGRILTTDYLMFSDPRALDKLSSLKNLEVRIFKTGDHKVGFHTKGYMFHKGDNLKVIIGSSNLTQDAITKNHEWNTRFEASRSDAFAKAVEAEFEALWNISVDYQDYREEYSTLFEQNKEQREKMSMLVTKLDPGNSKVLQPNEMQEIFSANILQLLQAGEKRAMLVSATGTGKTYASAFAVRQLLSERVLKGKRVLFLSHRE